MKSLRGRLIADIIPLSHERESGLIIVDRKGLSIRAKVVDVGDDSMSVTGRKLTSPAKVGEIIHFKRYKPMLHNQDGTSGHRAGLITVWWEDIIAVEVEEN